MSVSASALPKSSLRYEDRGNGVFVVEQALAQLGYLARDKYSKDKYFGSLTRDALKRFQSLRKLKVTGRYDAATRDSLKKALANKANTPAQTLKLDSKGAEVKTLESGLARLGYLANDKFARDGYFGTLTRDALKRLQTRRHLAPTGTYNQATRATIARMMKSAPAVTEPAHNYKRVSFRGATVNIRTREMMLRAEKYMKQMGLGGWSLSLIQGSYSTSVAASGNTHAGGGAVDISVRGPSGAYRSYVQVRKAVKALRMAGFAAWSRGFSDGTTFSKHIHAIAIGDRQMSSAARSQVHDYFAGRNGLANHGLDRDRGIGRPFPAWARKYR